MVNTFIDFLNVIKKDLKLGLPPLHRQFFIKISQNREYIQTFCKDKRNPFLFACRQWYLYNNTPFVIYISI